MIFLNRIEFLLSLNVIFVLYRRRSSSITPRRRRSRSPKQRRHKLRSPTPRRPKKHRSRSFSLSPTRDSSIPSPGHTELKINSQKDRKEEDEERKRQQHEAEVKLVVEETAKRLEEAIQRKVEESLASEEIKQYLQRHLNEGRKALMDEVAAQLKKEKEAVATETRQIEERAHKEKEMQERIVEAKERKVEEALRKEALEQMRREEERYRELEELQRQKEEAMRRKKQQEEEERSKQIKLLGKNKSRPKLSFAIGPK
ncbi:unnamed protein product [Linum trigynum]|uniref:Arginine and glutamate-rich protein 1 n=1 Tax=Linum trigynum TaxID=586398 RepID=A0AAV2CNI5_9ROSI